MAFILDGSSEYDVCGNSEIGNLICLRNLVYSQYVTSLFQTRESGINYMGHRLVYMLGGSFMIRCTWCD